MREGEVEIADAGSETVADEGGVEPVLVGGDVLELAHRCGGQVSRGTDIRDVPGEDRGDGDVAAGDADRDVVEGRLEDDAALGLVEEAVVGSRCYPEDSLGADLDGSDADDDDGVGAVAEIIRVFDAAVGEGAGDGIYVWSGLLDKIV